MLSSAIRSPALAVAETCVATLTPVWPAWPAMQQRAASETVLSHGISGPLLAVSIQRTPGKSRGGSWKLTHLGSLE
jgi:hypothetical protein